MARVIPGAQVVVLPGGHGGYLGEIMAVVPRESDSGICHGDCVGVFERGRGSMRGYG